MSNVIVFEELTSLKGAKIEVHFEEEKIKEFLQNNVSEDEFQRKMHTQIDREGVDTGKGTVIHLLINSLYAGKPMKEDEYNEWQAKENKDWFYIQNSFKEMLDVILPLKLMNDLFSELSGMDDPFGEYPVFGMPMEILTISDIFRDIEDNDFIDPTLEQMKSIFSDPKNEDKILAIKENDPSKKCKFCMVPIRICSRRNASFDYEGVKTALAAQ